LLESRRTAGKQTRTSRYKNLRLRKSRTPIRVFAFFSTASSALRLFPRSFAANPSLSETGVARLIEAVADHESSPLDPGMNNY
jgi:hypothetical protein